MKKKLRISFLAMFVIICNIATFSLAANEQVTLTNSKKDVKSGDTFEVTISQQSDGLTGFESTLNYDKNVFSLEKKELGTGWIDIGNETKLDAMSNSSVKSGDVFKLTFKVKENVSATTSEIKLTGIKLYKTSSDSVEIADKAISVNVAGGSSSDNDNNNSEELKGITLDYTNLTLVLGTTTKFNINVSANPLTASLPKIVWSTSDERIAKLEETDTNGSITIVPVSAGNVAITAKTSDGRYSATCNVTVNANGNASGNTSNTGNNTNGTNTVTNNTNKNTNTNINTNTNTNTNKVTNTNTTDNTTTTSNLPRTGSTTKYILLIVAGLIGISFIAYKGYKKYKEI